MTVWHCNVRRLEMPYSLHAVLHAAAVGSDCMHSALGFQQLADCLASFKYFDLLPSHLLLYLTARQPMPTSPRQKTAQTEGGLEA